MLRAQMRVTAVQMATPKLSKVSSIANQCLQI